MCAYSDSNALRGMLLTGGFELVELLSISVEDADVHLSADAAYPAVGA